MLEMYALPCGTVTDDPALAAELWTDAIYQAKDSIQIIRPVPGKLIQGTPIRDLEVTLHECDAVLLMGEK